MFCWPVLLAIAPKTVKANREMSRLALLVMVEIGGSNAPQAHKLYSPEASPDRRFALQPAFAPADGGSIGISAQCLYNAGTVNTNSRVKNCLGISGATTAIPTPPQDLMCQKTCGKPLLVRGGEALTARGSGTIIACECGEELRDDISERDKRGRPASVVLAHPAPGWAGGPSLGSSVSERTDPPLPVGGGLFIWKGISTRWEQEVLRR